jgi:hypothetical protein
VQLALSGVLWPHTPPPHKHREVPQRNFRSATNIVHLNMFLKTFTKIIVVSSIFAGCSAKVDGIERGGKKSSGIEVDENGPRL